MTRKYCLTLSTQKADKRRKIEDNWFHECRTKKIPFVTVYQKAVNSDIHHDYINLPADLDDVFSGADGDSLADDIISLFHRFYVQTPGSAMSVKTSSDVTWFHDVPNGIAPTLAEELFDLISLRISPEQ
ncbi:hypothetical protein AB1287_15195 [Enterobacter asburiae]|uniref:hypothetical protein n=1 Tax=Scandinavium sp. UTDF21-P1B TaxID=3446379 RepID=UPI00347D029B